MFNALKSLIKFAFQSATLNDSGKFSVGQASYLGKTSKYAQVFPYGYAAAPPIDTRILMFNVLGQEQNLAGIPYASEKRFKNLKAGEVVVGNEIKNTTIKFDESGNIIISTTQQDVIINSARNVTVNASNTININSNSDTNIVSNAKINLTANNDIDISTTNQTVNINCRVANITASNDANVIAGRDAKVQGNRDVNVIATTRDVNVTASRFIKLTAGTRVDIVGNLVVSGNITDGTGKTMSSIITNYNAHTHVSAAPGNPTSTTSNPI